jgi:hypothetical protein
VSDRVLPRVIALNEDFLLDKAANRLWDSEVIADDTSTFAPLWWFVGAHGGAGTTTLATLLAPAGDAGHSWPVHEENRVCVVVAKASVPSLEKAHQVLLQGQQQVETVDVIGVVVVAETPGKYPNLVKNKIDVLRPLTTVWELEYLSDLRLVEVDKLAMWLPGDVVDTTRRGRKVSVIERVPVSVARLGEEIVAAVLGDDFMVDVPSELGFSSNKEDKEGEE